VLTPVYQSKSDPPSVHLLSLSVKKLPAYQTKTFALKCTVEIDFSSIDGGFRTK